MKKLIKRAGLLAVAFALALMVALSLSGSLALPATANGGSDLVTSPTATPTSGSGGGSVRDSTCESPTPNPGGIDTDCDGLIEIATSAQLNAIRYDTNHTGNMIVGIVDVDEDPGKSAYSAAFGTDPTFGMPHSHVWPESSVRWL